MQKADKLIVRFRLGKIKITTRKLIFCFNKKKYLGNIKVLP